MTVEKTDSREFVLEKGHSNPTVSDTVTIDSTASQAAAITTPGAEVVTSANEPDSKPVTSAPKPEAVKPSVNKAEPKARRLTAFTGARLEFLQSELDKYSGAVTSRKVQVFLEDLFDRYFRCFPESKPHNVDPSPEEMAAVDDDSDDDPHPAPERQPGQTAQQFEEEMEKYRELQDQILKRMDQIIRWLRYHSKNGLLEAHVLYLNKLAGIKSDKPPRRSTAYNLWYKYQDNFLDAAIDEAYRELKSVFERKRAEAEGGEVRGDGGKVIKGPARVAVCQDIVKSEFEKMSKKEQEDWLTKAEEDHQKRLEKWALPKELHFSTDPEDKQRSIDLLRSWVMPLLEGIQGLTGLNASLFCSGPLPAEQGRINVLGPCDTFGTVYREQIQKYLNPMFADFCTRTHSLEECRRSSLGAEAQLGELFDDDAVFLERVGAQERATFFALSGDPRATSSSDPRKATSTTRAGVEKARALGNAAAMGSVLNNSASTSSKSIQLSTSTVSSASTTNTSAKSSTSSSVIPTTANITKTATPSASSTNTSRREHERAAHGASSAKDVAAQPTAAGVSKAAAGGSKAVAGGSKAVAGSKSQGPAIANTFSSRSHPRPPPVIAASSLLGKSKPGLSVGRPLPVGGKIKREDVSVGDLASNGTSDYPSKINVAALRRRQGYAAMGRNYPVPPLAGDAQNPIILGSSPPQPSPPKRQPHRTTPISVSSQGSSPIPSPTRKRRRISSPSPSPSGPSERTASPHLPMRPKTVAASSPPESSQPRGTPACSQSKEIRGSHGRDERHVEADMDLKVEDGSPFSSASAEEISVALSREMETSSPAKPTPNRRRARSEVYVEIEQPRKRVKRTPAAGGEQTPVVSGSRRRLGEKIKGKGGEKEVKEKGKQKQEEYIVNLLDGAPAYLQRTLDLCSIVVVGGHEELWTSLASHYAALEEFRNFKGGQLGAERRPEVVGTWIKSARTPRFHPSIDVAKFRQSFQAWWWNVNPEWRQHDDDDGLVLRRGNGSWSQLIEVFTGPNGLTSVMAALAWWLNAVVNLPSGNPWERKLRLREEEEWEESELLQVPRDLSTFIESVTETDLLYDSSDAETQLGHGNEEMERHLELLASVNPEGPSSADIDDIFERRAQRADFIRNHPTYDKPFWILSQKNGLRRICQALVQPANGPRTVGTPHSQFRRNYFATHGRALAWFDYAEAAFGITLFIEFLIKIIADGFMFTPNAYLKSVWNCIDLAILLGLTVNVTTDLVVAGGLSTRALKALRVLRLITLFDRMRNSFQFLIISGASRIIDAAVLAILYTIPYAVWGLNIFAGRMNECNDEDVINASECIGEYSNTPIDDGKFGFLVPRVWDNPAPSTKFSFHDFKSSLLILFEIVSPEGWIDVMDIAISVTGKEQQPQLNVSKWNDLKRGPQVVVAGVLIVLSISMTYTTQKVADTLRNDFFLVITFVYIVGFMFPPERLDVLLSRARNGLIMIGNSDTFTRSRKGGGMWTRLLDMLKAKGHVYDGLPVKCESHPDRKVLLKAPVNFENEWPDGGCNEPCGTRLSCGLHDCPSKCHQLADHSKMKCNGLIKRTCPQGHDQSHKCHQKAPSNCRKCEEEAKMAHKKQEEALAKQQKREAEELAHAQELAKIEEQIAQENQRVQDEVIVKSERRP
ncbi:calcium channel protein [Marasmius crinis-equi]|uniref:Calcium channel protein n=1 Tax=Marasmius crinis-equi TaxID=585013 RepID=A0ABR3ET23_9AGAR